VNAKVDGFISLKRFELKIDLLLKNFVGKGFYNTIALVLIITFIHVLNEQN
jgi:hypothetical protein